MVVIYNSTLQPTKIFSNIQLHHFKICHWYGFWHRGNSSGAWKPALNLCCWDRSRGVDHKQNFLLKFGLHFASSDWLKFFNSQSEYLKMWIYAKISLLDRLLVMRGDSRFKGFELKPGHNMNIFYIFHFLWRQKINLKRLPVFYTFTALSCPTLFR